MVRYLFNSAGEWIAFLDEGHLYDPKGEVIGWIAEDGETLVDVEGRYYGTLYSGDRLYRKLFAPDTVDSSPGYPGTHPRPLPPAPASAVKPPIEAEDIRELLPA